jgi:hypothetical protein
MSTSKSTKTNPPKQNITEVEVYSTFGLPIRLLRNMRMRGDGPPWKKISGRLGQRGGRVIYPVAEIERWITSRPGGGEVTAKRSSAA